MTTERQGGTGRDEDPRDGDLGHGNLGDGDPREGGLDALLAQARDLRPRPSQALLARVLADAEAVGLARAAPAGPPAAGPATGRATGRAAGRAEGPGWLRGLSDLLGGWPALGSLLASTALGFGLGLAQPAAVSGLTASIWGDGVSVPLGLDEDPLGALEASLGGAAPAPAPASTPVDG